MRRQLSLVGATTLMAMTAAPAAAQSGVPEDGQTQRVRIQQVRTRADALKDQIRRQWIRLQLAQAGASWVAPSRLEVTVASAMTRAFVVTATTLYVDRRSRPSSSVIEEEMHRAGRKVAAKTPERASLVDLEVA